MSSYKGESPGKKLARMQHWQAVICGACTPGGRDMPGTWTRGLLQDFEECPELRVLVLASAEGGDIAVLKALGVRPSQIVACDIDPEAAEACRRKHPDVCVEVGNVADVARSMPELYAAFLDFCGQTCPSYVETAAQVAAALPPSGGVLSIGVMRGRESDVGSLKVRANRSMRRHMKSIGSAAMASGQWSGKTRRTELGTSRRVDTSRALLWQEAIRAATGHPWTLVQTWNYHSAVNGVGGVPMAIITMMSGFGIASIAAKGRLMVLTENVRCDEAGIRKVALSVPGAAERLNIPARTLAAWRAHQTMGTYESTVPAVCPVTASEPDNASDTDPQTTVKYDVDALY